MELRGGKYTTDFSEFTYGYALTRNLEQRARIAAVPSFPNQIAEGQSSGGYDVRIENPIAPLFIQFKIPRVITKKHPKSPEKGLVDPPHYRMYLHPRDQLGQNRSGQHQLMLDRESEGKLIYYASPEFDQTAQIDNYYRSSMVADSSVFFRPGDIGPLPDEKEHYVAYKEGATVGYLCSEPKQVKLLHGEQFVGLLNGMALPVQRREAFFDHLITDLYRIAETQEANCTISRVALEAIGRHFNGTAETQAAYLTQVLLDCQLFILYAPPSSEQRG